MQDTCIMWTVNTIPQHAAGHHISFYFQIAYHIHLYLASLPMKRSWRVFSTHIHKGNLVINVLRKKPSMEQWGEIAHSTLPEENVQLAVPPKGCPLPRNRLSLSISPVIGHELSCGCTGCGMCSCTDSLLQNRTLSYSFWAHSVHHNDYNLCFKEEDFMKTS